MNIIKKEPAKSRLRNDFILIIILCLVAVLCFVFFFWGAKDGGWAVVSYDGMEIARYQLSTDMTETLYMGVDGEWYNVISIKDGKVSVSDANCPDGICVAHRAISRTGETVVCLPHKLVVYIETTDGGVDLVG